MKFYEIHEPYYALIKAGNKEKAREEYISKVADDEGTVMQEMNEVDRDYAVARFSRAKAESGKDVPLEEILKQIKSDSVELLIIDGLLL